MVSAVQKAPVLNTAYLSAHRNFFGISGNFPLSTQRFSGNKYLFLRSTLGVRNYIIRGNLRPGRVYPLIDGHGGSRDGTRVVGYSSSYSSTRVVSSNSSTTT